jgi:predicted oxidoreductase (fatty acid repression mutant protein)
LPFANLNSQILFFEEQTIIEDMKVKFAIYADKFPQWSEHTSAMHQFALWVALEAEGFGANLQHVSFFLSEDSKQVD